MKKIFTFLMTLAMVLALAAPACAYHFAGWWSMPAVEAAQPSELDAPAVTEARFYHRGVKRLQVQWDSVDGAGSYVALVVRADGVTQAYVTEDNSLFLKDEDCPTVFVEDASTWTGATVRVMAVNADGISQWSAAVQIGCDALH